MPNVVFDASSIVGAALKEASIPEQALLLARAYDTICLSDAVEAEIREVLLRPKFRKYISDLTRERILDILAAAALKVACDLVDEGMINEEEAVLRVEPKQLDALLHPQFDAEVLKKAQAIGQGLAASPGAACGKVVFSAEDAKEWAEKGEKVVLVRLETSPEDIEGMAVAQGILTVRGGMTSHAAVVARGMGTCCVSGCGEIVVSYEKKQFTLAGKTIKEGDYISIDGSTGNIYAEAIEKILRKKVKEKYLYLFQSGKLLQVE